MLTIISDHFVRFATEFTKAYTQRLIEKIKREIEGEPIREYQLEKAPLASEPLKKGTLSKQGGFFKSWKVRHFIAYNEKDNFRVDYLEKEGGKVKGSISCCGYNVEVYDKDEESKIGHFGIKLVSSPSRRVWYILASNKEEQDAWLQVFRTCCWKSRPERNSDPVVADAFDDAYWKVRWYYGFWGSYTPWGTEDERLGDLMLSILDREVIHDVVEKLPAGSARSTMEFAIRSPIDNSVKATASGSWTSSVSACTGMRGTLESSIKSLLTPLIEQQKSIRDKIVEAAGGVVNPVVSDIGSRILSPVLGVSCVPIAQAMASAATAYSQKMKEICTSSDISPEHLESTIQRVDYMCWWNLHSSFQIVWGLCEEKLAHLPSAFWENISYWTIYYMVQDAMTEVYRNACYTFKKITKGATSGAQLEAALSEVMRMYAHDSRVSIRKLLVSVLRKFLNTAVNDLILKPLLSTLAPLQETIDNIPIPGLATLINMDDMAKVCVERIIQDALSGLVDTGFMGSMEGELAKIQL